MNSGPFCELHPTRQSASAEHLPCATAGATRWRQSARKDQQDAKKQVPPRGAHHRRPAGRSVSGGRLHLRTYANPQAHGSGRAEPANPGAHQGRRPHRGADRRGGSHQAARYHRHRQGSAGGPCRPHIRYLSGLPWFIGREAHARRPRWPYCRNLRGVPPRSYCSGAYSGANKAGRRGPHGRAHHTSRRSEGPAREPRRTYGRDLPGLPRRLRLETNASEPHRPHRGHLRGLSQGGVDPGFSRFSIWVRSRPGRQRRPGLLSAPAHHVSCELRDCEASCRAQLLRRA